MGGIIVASNASVYTLEEYHIGALIPILSKGESYGQCSGVYKRIC
jgi:hypothetical protein